MIDFLKVGPVVYTVKEVSDLHSIEDDGKKQLLNGRIRYADSEIQISTDQSTQRKLITLWHEAIHGIIDTAGYEYHDEQQICALGFGLVQLIRDNPSLTQLTVGETAHGNQPAATD